MKKSFLLFSVLLMLFSCSTDEKIENPTPNLPIGQTPGTPPLGTFQFIAETTTVLPYEILMLSSNNQVFSNETYDAKFGGRDVSLIKNPEGNLLFAIPDIESGEYTLELNIGEKEGKINFKVNPSQISDVAAVIKEELEEPLKILKQDVDALISQGGNTAGTIDQLNSAKLMHSDFIDKYSNLSDDEKMNIAKFYKANPIFSSNVDNNNRSEEKAAENSFSCFRKNADRIATSAAILPDWEIISIHLNGTGAEGMTDAAVGAYVGGYTAASILLSSRELLTSSCTRPVSSSLVDEGGNTDNFELINNTFTPFQLKTRVRSLVASDANDSNEMVSKTVANINLIAENWGKNKTILNTVTSNTSGWFNSWFPENRSYEPISSMQNLPVSSENENLLEGNTEFISITGLPSGVTAELEKSEAGKLDIKFNGPENTLPRDITGKTEYENGVFRLENTFKVNLSAAARNYKLELGYYNLDQTITTEKILSPGDAITLPNNMNKYVRLTLNGEPVRGTSVFQEGWYNWTFGDYKQTPVDSEDIFIEDYEFALSDEHTMVYFKIDLTLSNQAFRFILENEYKITEYQNGSIRSGPIKIKFNPGGTMELTNLQDGSVKTSPYDFFLGATSNEEQCFNYIFKTPIIGVLRTGDYGIHGAPTFTYILENGNLRTNVFPYGCLVRDSGYLFDKIN